MTERFGLLARTASGTGVLHQLTSVIARHAGDIASVEILGTRDGETSIYFEIERPSESDALFAELRALPIGKIDGTAAFDRNHGFIFLFNPDPRRLSARIALDASVGLTTGSRFAVREVQPQSGRYIATQSRTFWRRGDTLDVTLDGASALVLEVLPSPRAIVSPQLFGALGSARMNGTTLVLDSVSGEAGTPEQLTVALPSRSGVTHVTVNGANATMTRVGGNVVHVDVTFAGAAFRHLQPVIAWDSSFAGGRVTGTR